MLSFWVGPRFHPDDHAKIIIHAGLCDCRLALSFALIKLMAASGRG